MPDKTPRGRVEIADLSTCSFPPGARCAWSDVDSSLVLICSFPFIASIAVYPISPVPTSGALRDFTGSSTYLFLHATACGLRRISTSSPTRMFVCCLRCTLKPSASATSLSRSCTSTSGSAISPTAYRILCLRLAHLVRNHPVTPPWTQDSIRVGG